MEPCVVVQIDHVTDELAPSIVRHAVNMWQVNFFGSIHFFVGLY